MHTRRRLTLTTLLLLAGCGDDDAASSDAATSDATSSATEASGATTSSGAATTSAGPTGDPSGDPSTTNDASTSAGVTTNTPTTGETGETGEDIDGCVVLVDGETGNDDHSGNSWLFAKRTVNAALEEAALRVDPDGCAVWVAEGVYTPSPAPSFTLQPNVALYGGFAGGEGALDERDWEAHETVLSGELGDPQDPGDNARHVVLAADGARVDGFTIKGGVTGVEPGQREGAGILGTAGHLTVANCWITGNETGRGGDHEVGSIGGSGGLGAGIYFSGDTLELRDSVVSDNVGGPGGLGMAIGGTGGEGAGVAFIGATLVVERVVFENNRGGDGGEGGSIGGTGGGAAGLLVRATAQAVVEDCEVRGNVGGAGGYSPNLGGTGGGNALLATGSSHVLINDCLVRDNVAGPGGPGDNVPGGPGSFAGMLYSSYNPVDGLVLANSRFEGNGDGFGAGLGIVAEPVAPSGPALIVNTVVTGNSSPGQAAGMYVRANGNQAVTIAHCSIAGNTAGFSAGGLYYAAPETAGPESARLVNSIVWGNTADNNNPQIETSVFGFDVVDPVELQVIRSSIAGGCTDSATITCTDVLSESPLFVNLGAGDLHLGPGSTLVDAGDDGLIPPDLADLDDDGDVDEPTPLDLDALPRIAGAAVDLGALEQP
ncbi:MAG: hypothetical protein H6713_19560 [Myxococcales bacterium]|nr:hypothetical protein [Myxococcales bacterium]